MALSHYKLVLDDEVNVGDVIADARGDEPNWVVTDPRSMRIREALDDLDDQTLATIITGTDPQVRLAIVEPHGDVHPRNDFIWVEPSETRTPDRIEPETDGCWRVLSFQPLHTVFGPQGELIMSAATSAISVFGRGETGPVAIAYFNEVERLRTVPRAIDQAENAASEALISIGADGHWWECARTASWGFEFIALAARDLIGSVPGWTQEHYDLLTRPRRVAFQEQGPLHPADAPLAPNATQ